MRMRPLQPMLSRNRCQTGPDLINMGIMKRLSCIVLFLLSVLVLPVRADGGADDQYIVVYGMIQDADALGANHPAEALAKYRDAYAALQAFQKIYPDWNDRIVTFRLRYLQGKIAAITPQMPAASAVTNMPLAPPAAANPQPSVSTAEADRQIAALNEQLKQLQAEKDDLQSKLKEAFATQPATVDPRELANAREKIESLMKENDLLKVSLNNQPPGTSAVPESKAMEQMRRALADANRKLEDQTQRADNLTLEKQILLFRLASLGSQTNEVITFANTKKALDNANQTLATQSISADKFAQERDALQSRIQALTSAAAAADALRAENQGLKQQLADLAAKYQAQSQRLTVDETRIASLQSLNDVLHLEKAALEDRLKQTSSRPEDLARISQLESERDDLRQKLEAVSRQAAASPVKKSKLAAKVDELSGQISTMQARLDVLQARPVPYTPDELALFKKPPGHLDNGGSKGEMASVRQLPPGTAVLAAAAQRDFSASRFDQAHEKYQEILRQDENNVYTLANLAAIELEMNDLVAAEKHISLAMKIAPDDGYNLKILGYLRFRQEKYDEALDALSRAATAEPQSAEIQNYLGVTLSHKGLRIPAETALRKAIEIDPSYGNAHNNLAVIYATQQPPLLELARWHYQRALATGQPHNPELEKLLQLKPD
jgi:Tfp pilus assembly protein PilF